MRVIRGETFAELYEHTLSSLIFDPEYITAPRGQKIKEITNCALVLEDPTQNLFINDVRSVPLKYLAGELLWYFSERNDLKFISKFSSFWKKIANEDGTCNSAYGNLIFTGKEKSQFYWAYSKLVEDKDTRQSIMHFNKPEHQYEGNKDFVCTLIGTFQIRKNKLNFTIDMRSNDVFFGLTFDLPFFTMLQQQMLKHLKETKYPDLELGTYTHIAHSLHLYERDLKTVESMLEETFRTSSTPKIEKNLVNVYGKTSNSLLSIIEAIETNKFCFESDDFQERWLYENATNEA